MIVITRIRGFCVLSAIHCLSQVKISTAVINQVSDQQSYALVSSSLCKTVSNDHLQEFPKPSKETHKINYISYLLEQGIHVEIVVIIASKPANASARIEGILLGLGTKRKMSEELNDERSTLHMTWISYLIFVHYLIYPHMNVVHLVGKDLCLVEVSTRIKRDVCLTGRNGQTNKPWTT